MRIYKIKLMIQKEGKDPERLCFLDIGAASEQEALDIATEEGNEHFERVCATLGRRCDETTRIWAELTYSEAEED